MRLGGSKVLVTGADGFIGSHLVERLVHEGATVRALCLYNSNGSYGWLDELPRDVKSDVDRRLGDVRDQASVDGVVSGIEVVFHLAALIAIPYSYEAPASFIETNIGGTFHVLEAARHHGVGRLVHASTSEVYGTPEELPITEDHPLRGQSPYSATKIGADKLCEAWACSYDTPVAVLRPFNTYGPRQSRRAVIPTALSQLLGGVKELRLGSVHTRRDFTFVDDTVDGFVKAAESELVPGEVVHLGSGTAVSIEEVVNMAAGLLGVEVAVDTDPARVRPDRSEVQVLLSDPARALERLGWKPHVDLEEGLARTIEWLRARVGPEDLLRYVR